LSSPFFLRLQQARRYATETAQSSASKAAPPPPPPPSGGGSNTLLLLGGAAAVGGAGYYYYGGGSGASSKASTPPKPAFTGGDQGFLSLKLAEVEQVNDNTKRFRFELPESDNVSGLHIASAILTKYKGPNDAKATLRPYTPISDEGKLF
jgi:cytochrome-b5 reductase